MIHYKLTPEQLAAKRASRQIRGVGDIVEKLVKPIAVMFKMYCLDENKELKPESDCAKRRDRANEILPL